MSEKNSLWKNIRKNRGSGKEPTDEMIRQEKKIKSKKYAAGGPIEEESILYRKPSVPMEGAELAEREDYTPYRSSSVPMENYEPDASFYTTPSKSKSESENQTKKPNATKPTSKRSDLQNYYLNQTLNQNSSTPAELGGIEKMQPSSTATNVPNIARVKRDELERPDVYAEQARRYQAELEAETKRQLDHMYHGDGDPSILFGGIARKKAEKILEQEYSPVNDLDSATDIMQFGNFVPHPIAQFIGKVGSFGGAAVDLYQADEALSKGNYGDMTVNLASAGLGAYLGGKGRGYTRDMNNTVPGSIADKIAKLGSRSGTYRPLTATPNLRNNDVIKRGLNYNRGILGSLGAETIYDSKAEGGTIGEDGIPYRPLAMPMESYQPQVENSFDFRSALNKARSNKINLGLQEYEGRNDRRLEFNPYLDVITPEPNTYVYSGGVNADLNLYNKNNNRLGLTGGLNTGFVKHPGGTEYIGVEPSVGLSFTKKFNQGGTMDPPDGVIRFNEPTRADSLNVLNNTRAINDYYLNKNYTRSITKPITPEEKKRLSQFFTEAVIEESQNRLKPENYLNTLKKSRDFYKDFNVKGNFGRHINKEGTLVQKPASFNEFYQKIDDNRFLQRESSAGTLDIGSPMPLYDTRITPQTLYNYDHPNNVRSDELMDLINKTKDINKKAAYKKELDNLPTDTVELFQYDPLAITPWDMLDEKQQAERIDKYGVQGTPYKSKEDVGKMKSKNFAKGIEPIGITGSVQDMPTVSPAGPEGHYRVVRVSPHAEPYYQVWEDGKKWTDKSPEEFDKISQEKYLTEYKKYGGTMSNNKKKYLKYAQGGTFGDDKKRTEVLNSPANEGSFIFKPATDWATNWVNDPEYAARLNQNFPDRSKITKLDTVFQSKKDARQDKREKNLEGFSNYIPKLVGDIGDTRFLYNSDPAANEKLYGNYSSMYNEEDAAEVKKELKKNPQAFTDPYGNTIIRNRSNDPGQAGAMSAANHEIWHQLEIPAEKTDMFGNTTYETLDRAYDGKFATPDPSTWPLDEKGQPKMPSKKEFYPMLMQLRMDNDFKPGEEIDDARLDQIRKAGSSNPLLKYYNNEQLKTYLNTLASTGSQSQPGGVQRAAYGGTIKMNNGGTPSFGSTLPTEWGGDSFDSWDSESQGFTTNFAQNQYNQNNGVFDPFVSGSGPLAPPGSPTPQQAPAAPSSSFAPNSGVPKEASGMVYKGLDMIAPGVGTAAKIGDSITDMAAGLGQDFASHKLGYRNQEEKDIAFKYSNKLDNIPVLGTQIGMGIDAFRGMSGKVKDQITDLRLDNQVSNSYNYLGNAKSYVMAQGGSLPFNEYKGLTHDEVNPMTGETGIPLPKTNPNAPTIEVEDGEVSLGSNVYSNRLFYKEPAKKGEKGITFAAEAKKINAQAVFRPNDKITKQTTEMKLDKLFKMQEMQKAAAQDRYDIMKADMMSNPGAEKIMAKYGGRIKMGNAGDLEAVTPENIMSMSGINEGALNLAQMGQMVAPAMQVFQAARDKDELKFDRVDVPRLDTFTAPQIMKQQAKEQVASTTKSLASNAGNQSQYLAARGYVGAKAASDLGRNIALMKSDLLNKQAAMDFEGNRMNTELENKEREYRQARRDFLRKQKLEGTDAGFGRLAGAAKDDAAFRADLFAEAIKANSIGGEEYMLGYDPDGKTLKYKRRTA